VGWLSGVDGVALAALVISFVALSSDRRNWLDRRLPVRWSTGPANQPCAGRGGWRLVELNGDGRQRRGRRCSVRTHQDPGCDVHAEGGGPMRLAAGLHRVGSDVVQQLPGRGCRWGRDRRRRSARPLEGDAGGAHPDGPVRQSPTLRSRDVDLLGLRRPRIRRLGWRGGLGRWWNGAFGLHQVHRECAHDLFAAAFDLFGPLRGAPLGCSIAGRAVAGAWGLC